MLEQTLAVTGIGLVSAAGLAASNLLYDRGVPNTVSRYAAPMLGGLAFLVAVLWLEARTAIVLAAVLTLGILALRLGFRHGLRGVRGDLPTQAWSEVTYATAGTVSLAVGWGLLGDRWLAFLPIAFMAWGDSAAGLLRATVWQAKPSTLWPSLGIFGICLAAAALFQPYWIAALGALVATAAERRRPNMLIFWDDNLHLVVMSLAVMAVMVKSGL